MLMMCYYITFSTAMPNLDPIKQLFQGENDSVYPVCTGLVHLASMPTYLKGI